VTCRTCGELGGVARLEAGWWRLFKLVIVVVGGVRVFVIVGNLVFVSSIGLVVSSSAVIREDVC